MSAIRVFFLLACFLGLGSFVAGSDLSYEGIPSCAIKCIFQEIGHSSCALTDQQCMCNDNVLAGYVQVCVEANCTVIEMLAARNQSLAACGVPVTQEDSFIKWFRALIFAFTTFFIIVRMVNKCLKLSSWGWDDATIVIAYAVLVAFLPAGYLAEETGAGRDIWTLNEDQITNFLLLFNLLIWVAFITGTFGCCQPLNFFWHGWKGDMKGKCFDLNAFAMSHGALNVALDAWMLVLPAKQVFSLRMQRKKKLGVMLMFSVGIFLTAVSAYRIKALLIFATSYNITADSFQSSIWSNIELCVGIFVACLPSTRQAWRKLFPKILEVTHLSSRSSRLSRSAKGSHSASQASRSAADPYDRPRVVSYEESSIAHLVGDFNNIDLNQLSDASPMETDPSKTPKNHVEVQSGPTTGSSRSSDGSKGQDTWDT
ncbi:CFEM domain-containing protein [Colletotrichum orchidophilum]|uniref:CFEM domain-containing protein n=1 Tax=Colletotrichum orchidophilum TaxID=1209926 RepID=A0A1G4AQR8_9PEZI|nr:CFEM domain-containing protein [Colletotrichum orchidophilum]OHE91517.1 CFEM domain-containing protein [Colletotrichum orchidophilum]